MHYQNLIIIRECSKKLLEMKNSKSFFLTPSTTPPFTRVGTGRTLTRWMFTQMRSTVCTQNVWIDFLLIFPQKFRATKNFKKPISL